MSACSEDFFTSLCFRLDGRHRSFRTPVKSVDSRHRGAPPYLQTNFQREFTRRGSTVLSELHSESVLVIYTRFSSDLQSNKSCTDQEREVREALTKMGIDHTQALVIHDEAESGTKTFRDEFARVDAMMRGGQIRILAADDQSRLSRSDNTFAFITDLVYSGGRFISTGEGIDTEQTGWELRVKVMELHNSTTIRELGRRVRRGQLSAGDYCYGYESYLIDPEKAADLRGPKPERGVRINDDQAKWVQKIFSWCIEERSIRWIADELNRQHVPTGHRCQSDRWRPTHVRKILDNEKYVGVWRWGTTRTIRNSKGRKKQIPVSEEQHVVVKRPELRIIDHVSWEAAQNRLAELKDLYGQKEGQKQRGPKVHHTAVYPSGLLAGIVFCSKCGSRLWQQASGPRLYLGCPKRGSDKGCCEMTTRVPLEKAEQDILEFLARMLMSCPQWLKEMLSAMRQEIEDVARRVPEEVMINEQRLRELDSQIANLVDALAQGHVQSSAVQTRLHESEREAEQVRQKIITARKLLSAPVLMPDDTWIEQQLDDLASVIRDGGYEASLLLRKTIERIEADQVIPTGKTRGYARLRFRINGWETLKMILESADSRDKLNAFLNCFPRDDSSEQFVIDLGGPSLMDQWAHKIAEMRAEGVKWTEIVEVTGLDLNRAYRAWKRFVDAQSAESESPTDSDSRDDTSDGSSTTDEAS